MRLLLLNAEEELHTVAQPFPRQHVHVGEADVLRAFPPRDLAEARGTLIAMTVIAVDGLLAALRAPLAPAARHGGPAISAPMKRRPKRRAARPVVPLPVNGATMRSPGAVRAEMI